MTSARWDDDDRLLADLRAALAAPLELPAGWQAAADAAWSWRTVEDDLRLATLSFDSRLQPVGGVRGDAESRTLVFDWPGLSLEVEVLPGQLVGQLVPLAADGLDTPAPVVRGAVQLLTADGQYAAVETDDTGSFLVMRPEHGPVRLLCRAGDVQGRTDWLTL